MFRDPHNVGNCILEYTTNGSSHICHSGCVRIVRVVRKHFKKIATDDAFARGQGTHQVGVARGYDRELGREDEVKPGQRLEEALEFGPAVAQFGVDIFELGGSLNHTLLQFSIELLNLLCGLIPLPVESASLLFPRNTHTGACTHKQRANENHRHP